MDENFIGVLFDEDAQLFQREIVCVDAKRILDLFRQRLKARKNIKHEARDQSRPIAELWRKNERHAHDVKEDELLYEDMIGKRYWRFFDALTRPAYI